MNFRTLAAIALTSVGLLGAPLSAQQLTNVTKANDWDVYVDQNNAKHCYIVTTPKSSRAIKNGENVNVSRGDIRLYIGIKNGATEPSFMAGYPLKNDRAVELKIGSNTINYFANPNTNSEFAWPQPNNDSNVINAMKAGSSVQVTAMSQRGTTTIDNFSLSGFTAAYNAAVERCR